MDGGRRFNTYLCFSDSLSLRNHRDLKRVLLADPELRREYGDYKDYIVTDIGADTVNWYCREKNSIVGKILRAAGWSEADLRVVMKKDGSVSM